MPWWVHHVGREIAAFGVIAGLIAITVLVLALIYLPTGREGELVEGEIVGFHGYYMKGAIDNQVLASVRLSEGRILNVAVPRYSAASRCRVGDRISMVRQGGRLLPHGSGCGRS